jgi:hypothetical protein
MLALECEAVHISTIFVAFFRRPALGPPGAVWMTCNETRLNVGRKWPLLKEPPALHDLSAARQAAGWRQARCTCHCQTVWRRSRHGAAHQQSGTEWSVRPCPLYIHW